MVDDATSSKTAFTRHKSFLRSLIKYSEFVIMNIKRQVFMTNSI